MICGSRALSGFALFLFLLLLVLFLVVLLAGYLFSYLSGSDITYALFITPLGLAGLFALSFFAVITRQRSAYGQRKLEEVLGLKDFIETVEMDQLKQMIDTDPAFYYRLLSYAIVLGLEKKWAKKFSLLHRRTSLLVFRESATCRCSHGLLDDPFVRPCPGDEYRSSQKYFHGRRTLLRRRRVQWRGASEAAGEEAGKG